jgi:hypothetical protein
VNLQAERHPIQNLLDEVDRLIIGVPSPDGYGGVSIQSVELDDELKAHVKDQLMSAYATGVVKGAKNA